MKDSLLAPGNNMSSTKWKKKTHFGPPYLVTKSEGTLKSEIYFSTNTHTQRPALMARSHLTGTEDIVSAKKQIVGKRM